MQVVQTAGLPPNQGRITLLMTGCTWNNRKALDRMTIAEAAANPPFLELFGTAVIGGDHSGSIFTSTHLNAGVLDCGSACRGTSTLASG